MLSRDCLRAEATLTRLAFSRLNGRHGKRLKRDYTAISSGQVSAALAAWMEARGRTWTGERRHRAFATFYILRRETAR